MLSFWCFNNPGFGKTKPTDGNAITMSEYANEVKNLIDKLHVQKVIIGGESKDFWSFMVNLIAESGYPQLGQ